MKSFWRNVGQDAKVLRFLPDKASQSRPINRQFAYTVLASLKPDFAQKIYQNALNKRATPL